MQLVLLSTLNSDINMLASSTNTGCRPLCDAQQTPEMVDMLALLLPAQIVLATTQPRQRSPAAAPIPTTPRPTPTRQKNAPVHVGLVLDHAQEARQAVCRLLWRLQPRIFLQ